ncbi:MAG: hypothetical protein ACTHKU_16015, partial [Verrucomicrobiota bacterium]
MLLIQKHAEDVSDLSILPIRLDGKGRDSASPPGFLGGALFRSQPLFNPRHRTHLDSGHGKNGFALQQGTPGEPAVCKSEPSAGGPNNIIPRRPTLAFDGETFGET